MAKAGPDAVPEPSESQSPRPLKAWVAAAMMAAVTAVLAYVSIPLPFSPVPVTGQTLGVMLAGMLLGPSLGLLSMVIYTLMGVAGMPVLAGGTAGVGALLGPSGGYIFGFIIGAYVTGLLAQGSWGAAWLRRTVAAAVGGVLCVYLLGVPWLSVVAGLEPWAAVVAGAAVFVPGDAVKVVVAVAIADRMAAFGWGPSRWEA